MRVSDVAKGADTSITLIYRYFVDRNGVLARVLGDMYDEFRMSFQTKVEAWLAVNDSLSLEDFARLMPNPAEETKHARDFRVQVLGNSTREPRAARAHQSCHRRLPTAGCATPSKQTATSCR